MPIRFFLLPAVLLAASMAAHGQPKTVCTITVNSDDEKRALAQRLPAGEYRFEELLDRTGGLGSACQRSVQCDVLVVSGHFNAGDDFYPESVNSNAALNMDELERASCSESCPGLFARLKEVYLFGCESFSADPTRNAAYGESSRSRMRRIFAGVPAIYGFSSSAPVGPTAAMLLNRTFDSGGQSAFATGRPNAALLRAFKANSITWASGLPRDAAERRRMCPIFDDRLGPAQKLRALHRLATDAGTDAGAFAQRIDDFFETLSEEDRRAPEFQRALAGVAADRATAAHLLAVARRSPPATRAHVVAASGKLGWLDAGQQRDEYVRMILELLARDQLGFAEVRLICGLGADGMLEEAIPTVMNAPSRVSGVSHAAALACMGSAEAHAQVIRALASPDERDVRIAEAYLRSRPVTDPAEVRIIATGVIRMPASEAQVRALDTLGRLPVSDAILEQLTATFAEARSASVQRAIAEVFLRAGYRPPGLAGVLRAHRIAAGKRDLVDELIGRLQGSS